MKKRFVPIKKFQLTQFYFFSKLEFKAVRT